MNGHVSTSAAPEGATAATCAWCEASVATAVWPGEREPVYVDHPLPAPRGGLRCPASGLTASEVELPGGPQ